MITHKHRIDKLVKIETKQPTDIERIQLLFKQIDADTINSDPAELAKWLSAFVGMLINCVPLTFWNLAVQRTSEIYLTKIKK